MLVLAFAHFSRKELILVIGALIAFYASVRFMQGKDKEAVIQFSNALKIDKNFADAQKTVTLSGQIGCGHCAFNVAKSCTDVIRVKENGKDVIYFFTDDPSRKHDTAMCETVRNGKVTGVVGEKDGKKTLKVSKIEFTK